MVLAVLYIGVVFSQWHMAIANASAISFGSGIVFNLRRDLTDSCIWDFEALPWPVSMFLTLVAVYLKT